MGAFTHDPPPPDRFLHAMRETLKASGQADLAELLSGATAEFATEGSFSRRWNAYWYTFRLRVPLERVTKFSDVHKLRLRQVAEQLMPAEVGYDIDSVDVSPSFSWDGDDAPIDGLLEEVVKVDHAHVRAAWEKALARRFDDPEGAITSARTLLESVCKLILDERQVAYEPGWDLSRLYKEASRTLNLAPEQHQEQIFKQILSGCFSVVEGLAAVRNTLSDAHGRPKSALRPEARHAELAVNLALSMASFLMRSHEKKQAAKQKFLPRRERPDGLGQLTPVARRPDHRRSEAARSG